MTPDQPMHALRQANRQRAAIAAITAEARADRLNFEQLLLDPPDALAGYPLIDVLRLGRTRRNAQWIVRLGRDAARADVNLLAPLGRCSQRSRLWLVDWLQRHRATPTQRRKTAA